MMRRRSIRRNPQAPEQPRTGLARIPSGVYWTVLALVVLAMVLGYDRREQRDAQKRITHAHYLEEHEHYGDAIAEYKQALENKRLNLKTKAEVALALGNLYYDHLEDYDRASSYYVRAKHLSPKVVRQPSVQERMKLAKERSTGKLVPDEGTTQTIIDRVELIRQPDADKRGPVVARLRGEEIHAGEIQRALQAQPNWQEIAQKANDESLVNFVQEYLNRALVYRAAVDQGLQRAPDVSQRLYDYQKTLLSERYLSDAREKATQVSDKEIVDYYTKNHDQYSRPARISLAMIKTDTPEKAQKALEKLRQGTSFQEVAASDSMDTATVQTHGVIGTISEADPFIPGVGRVPEIFEKLLTMQPNQVTAVTKLQNAYYIFKILGRTARQERVLDEVRPEIVKLLRAQKLSAATEGLNSTLHKNYEAQIEREGLSHFWQFAGQSTRDQHEQSTTSTAAQTSSTSPTSSSKERSALQSR